MTMMILMMISLCHFCWMIHQSGNVGLMTCENPDVPERNIHGQRLAEPYQQEEVMKEEMFVVLDRR